MNLYVLYPALAAAIFLVGLSHLPWWLLIVPAVIAGFFQTTGRRAFLDAFVVAFAVWVVVAIVQDIGTGFRISHRIAGVFKLPVSPLAYVVTGLVAGLTAGAASLCGERVRSIKNYIPGGK